jgi:hypothetical protein
MLAIQKPDNTGRYNNCEKKNCPPKGEFPHYTQIVTLSIIIGKYSSIIYKNDNGCIIYLVFYCKVASGKSQDPADLYNRCLQVGAEVSRADHSPAIRHPGRR